MTLKTWKEEFYPVPANRKMSTEKAIEHSLRKWAGLLKSNMKKHDVYLLGDSITDVDTGDCGMSIDSFSCALCQKFYGTNVTTFQNECHNCLLYKTLGGRCDDPSKPYWLWIGDHNPRPMIRALQKTLKNYKEGKLK